MLGYKAYWYVLMLGYRECWAIGHATYSVRRTWVWAILVCEPC